MEVALALADLVKEGLVQHVGLTNFDGTHMKELLEAGVPVASNQVGNPNPK